MSDDKFSWDNIKSVSGSEHRIIEWEEQNNKEIQQARKRLKPLPKCGSNNKEKVRAKHQHLKALRKQIKGKKNRK